MLYILKLLANFLAIYLIMEFEVYAYIPVLLIIVFTYFYGQLLITGYIALLLFIVNLAMIMLNLYTLYINIDINSKLQITLFIINVTVIGLAFIFYWILTILNIKGISSIRDLEDIINKE